MKLHISLLAALLEDLFAAFGTQGLLTVELPRASAGLSTPAARRRWQCVELSGIQVTDRQSSGRQPDGWEGNARDNGQETAMRKTSSRTKVCPHSQPFVRQFFFCGPRLDRNCE